MNLTNFLTSSYNIIALKYLLTNLLQSQDFKTVIVCFTNKTVHVAAEVFSSVMDNQNSYQYYLVNFDKDLIKTVPVCDPKRVLIITVIPEENMFNENLDENNLYHYQYKHLIIFTRNRTEMDKFILERIFTKYLFNVAFTYLNDVKFVYSIGQPSQNNFFDETVSSTQAFREIFTYKGNNLYRSKLYLHTSLNPPRVLRVAKRTENGLHYSFVGVDAFMATLIERFMNATVIFKALPYSLIKKSSPKFFSLFEGYNFVVKEVQPINITWISDADYGKNG